MELLWTCEHTRTHTAANRIIPLNIWMLTLVLWVWTKHAGTVVGIIGLLVFLSANASPCQQVHQYTCVCLSLATWVTLHPPSTKHWNHQHTFIAANFHDWLILSNKCWFKRLKHKDLLLFILLEIKYLSGLACGLDKRSILKMSLWRLWDRTENLTVFFDILLTLWHLSFLSLLPLPFFLPVAVWCAAYEVCYTIGLGGLCLFTHTHGRWRGLALEITQTKPHGLSLALSLPLPL